MKNFVFFVFILAFISCQSTKKVEEKVEKGPSLKFKLSTQGIEKKGLWRQNLCIGDIDMDGNLDIISPPPRGDNYPVIFLGDGKGNWQEWKEVEFPNIPYAYGGVDIADIDKNGLPDLVFANHSGRIFVLLQKEKGKFEDFSKGFPNPDKFSARVARFYDFDGDGTEEIVSLNESPVALGTMKRNPIRQRIFKLENEEWKEIPLILKDKHNYPSCFGDSLDLGDFNLDGKMDFAVSCNDLGGKEVLFYFKDNGFEPGKIESLPDKSYLYYVKAKDLNNDGRADLVFAYVTAKLRKEKEMDPAEAYLAGILVAFNYEKGWEVQKIYERKAGVDYLQFRSVSAGDLNGDGFADLVSVLDSGEIFIFLNKDGKNFERASGEGLIQRGRSYWLEIVDLNKDGRNDLIIAYGREKDGGNLDVYLNEGYEISVK